MDFGGTGNGKGKQNAGGMETLFLPAGERGRAGHKKGDPETHKD